MSYFERLKSIAPSFHVRTPIKRLERLGERLGLNNLYIKRDDLTEFYCNKTRHAKYIIAYLRDQGISSVEMIGGGDSDTLRVYATAFRAAGITFKFTLTSAFATGNGFIMSRLDVAETTEFRLDYAESKHIAAMGYIEAAEELADFECPRIDRIYLYSYDAGWIGLSIGAFLNNVDLGRIVAVRGEGGPHGRLGSPGDYAYMNSAYKAAEAICDVNVVDRRIEFRELIGDFSGEIRLLLNDEGILLDPRYTARAMSALIRDAREGKIAPDENVIFIHTGGFFLNFK